jgi:hypothetical protein
MAVSVKRENNDLIIKVPLEQPKRSKSGKTLVVASTHGNLDTEIFYQRRHVVLVLNAFIYPKERKFQARVKASISRMDGKLK